MNISFLIKAVSIWIELTLIFFHMARMSAVVKRQPYFLFLPPNPSFPGSSPQLPPPPNSPTLQLQPDPSNGHFGAPQNEFSSHIRHPHSSQPAATPNIPISMTLGILRPANRFHPLHSSPLSHPLPNYRINRLSPAHPKPPSQANRFPVSSPHLTQPNPAFTNRYLFDKAHYSNRKHKSGFTPNEKLSFPPSGTPISSLPNARTNNSMQFYMSNVPLFTSNDDLQPYSFPNLLAKVPPYPPTPGFSTSSNDDLERPRQPPYLYRPTLSFQTPVYVMSGEKPTTNGSPVFLASDETFLCDLECRGRGYRVYENLSHDKCKCIESSDVHGAINLACDRDCERKCMEEKNKETGHCDSKGFCYCYNKTSTLEISGTCIIPLKICAQKCTGLGYLKYSCLKDLCNCSNGTQVISFDYNNGLCAVPRNYCRERCALSDFVGHCLFDQCICSKNGTYFVLDLFPNDSKCNACQTKCVEDKYEEGRCIAGNCLCYTDATKYKVLAEFNNSVACKLPIDFCWVHCAYMGLHYQAICRNDFTCSCGENGLFRTADFLKDTCFPSRQKTEHDCVEVKKFTKGLCSNQSALCHGI